MAHAILEKRMNLQFAATQMGFAVITKKLIETCFGRSLRIHAGCHAAIYTADRFCAKTKKVVTALRCHNLFKYYVIYKASFASIAATSSEIKLSRVLNSSADKLKSQAFTFSSTCSGRVPPQIIGPISSCEISQLIAT